ncbi:transcription repressor OFP13-like [Rutidosis leptorrhynchoides]|uniref:transcription repressor OFP13-like n=1 Tax=Rutidosis leptorrhynchoides TaxID=125765 RepID=UPI003A9A0982
MNLTPSVLLLNKHKQQLCLWPSCNHTKTLSFRATTDHNDFMLNNKDSSLVDQPDQVEVTTLGSYFTNSSESASVSSESEISVAETIVRGARSDRLFFEPDSTSSILKTRASDRQCSSSDDNGGGGGDGDGGLPYDESVAVVMESENPYIDFKKSMEEMVKIHELKEWECLEELLGWYLKMNGKNNHEFIVEAFVDLLVGVCGGDGDGGSGDGSGGGGEGGGASNDNSTRSFDSVSSTFSSPIPSPKMVVTYTHNNK